MSDVIRLIVHHSRPGAGRGLPRLCRGRSGDAGGSKAGCRNRRDGSVEAVFAGPAEEVALMIEACRKGPWSARVDGIDETEGTREQLAQRRVGEKFSVLTTV